MPSHLFPYTTLFRSPDRVADQLVHALMGGLEPAGAGDVRMHHDGFDVLGGELPGPPGDLRVAEPVEGEGRLEELSGGVPGQGDRVGGLRGAQRAGADRKSTRLNSSHVAISYAVVCLQKKRHAEPVRKSYIVRGE